MLLHMVTYIFKGILGSVIYVALSLAVSSVIKIKSNSFLARKVLHILMADWWFIRLYYIKHKWLWMGPAIMSIVLHVFCAKKKIKSGMGQFCVSMAIMTLITTYNVDMILPATASILVLGYADPMAALFGKIYQNHKKITRPYSLVGSMVFFAVASVVLIVCLYTDICWIYLLVLSALLTIVEAKVFSKYDNIMIPVVAFLLTFFVYI